MDRFEITTVGKVGKGLTVKREKGEKGEEVILAHLKFAETWIDRDAISRLCNRPLGWADGAFYDPYGAPAVRGVFKLPQLALSVTGRILGAGEVSALSLMQATLTDVEIVIADKGGMLSGALAWKAAGDEVSDAEDLIGRLCKFEWALTDGGQKDMFEEPQRVAA